jgi:hypothetical protein
MLQPIEAPDGMRMYMIPMAVPIKKRVKKVDPIRKVEEYARKKNALHKRVAVPNSFEAWA